MRRIIFVAALLIASPVVAEEDRGLSLMERGAQMLMEGLLQEMEPALEDLQDLAQDIGPAMQDFTRQMGPALRDLFEEVEDWSAYEAPEILDNGDIIIRRKPSVPEKPDSPEIEI